jgi:hypothetical protein
MSETKPRTHLNIRFRTKERQQLFTMVFNEGGH